MTKPVAALVGILMFAAAADRASTQDAPAAPPHIVFVLADDLGWTDLSTGRTCLGNGSPYHETPNLDALVAQGTAFVNAYSSGPNCAPTRAALWSGQCAARTGIYTVTSGNRGQKQHRKLIAADNEIVLRASFVTLPETLKTAGYQTGFFGKWHLGNQQDSASPTDQGFDAQAGGDRSGGVGRDSHFANEDGSFRFPGLGPNGKARQFLADRLTDEAIGWMGRATRPMFCAISHYSVHTPIQAPDADIAAVAEPEQQARHHHRRYAAMMKNLDDNVGRVVAFLRETADPVRPGQKLFANTLFVFTSDNGGLGGYARAGIAGGEEITDQAPLKSGKGSLHEGGIRVPFFAVWPGHVREGAVDETPLCSLDLYPTFAKIAGARRPDGYQLDGADLSARLLPVPGLVAERPLFWHFPGYLQANGRLGTWRTTPGSVIRRGDLKAIFWYETRTWSLYDLAADIGEERDVAAERPEDLRRLARELVAWLEATSAPMPRDKQSKQPVPLPAL